MIGDETDWYGCDMTGIVDEMISYGLSAQEVYHIP